MNSGVLKILNFTFKIYLLNYLFISIDWKSSLLDKLSVKTKISKNSVQINSKILYKKYKNNSFCIKIIFITEKTQFWCGHFGLVSRFSSSIRWPFFGKPLNKKYLFWFLFKNIFKLSVIQNKSILIISISAQSQFSV